MNSFTNNPSEFEIEDGMLMEYFGCGGHVVIPEGITDIFYDVFTNNTTITKLTLPKNMPSIAAFEFEGCTSLTEVKMQDGVTTIAWNAFCGCTALTKIILPKTLENIYMNAFKDCCALKEICFGGSIDEWNSVKKEKDWDKNTGDYIIIYNYSDT